MKLSALSALLLIPAVVWAGKPIPSLSVTLRGKKFDVEDASTVQDVLKEIKDAAGVDGRLLFGGRQLAASDSLDDMGVKDGDSLQMVPGTTTTKKKKSKPKSAAAAAVSTAAVTTPPPAAAGGMPDLSEMLKGMGGAGGGGMPDISELLKGMGGAGGGMPDMSELLKGAGGGGMPDMAESMDMMAGMMNNPMFQEYMSDPEKLEASRQMILQNPLMKQMMSSMPGMAEILEDPEAWREAMSAAANLYKEMDPEQLKQAMMGSMPDAGDMDGLFGAPGLEGAAGALDELSEGED